MSTSHTFHEDSHTHGLADDCPRCAEHAKDPLKTLDDTNVHRLIERVVEREEPRSDTEGLAMRAVRDALDRAAFMASIDSRLLCQYINRHAMTRLADMAL